MRRSLHVAAAIVASGALASACLLDAGPLPTSGSGGSGATGGSGGTGASTLACGNGILEEGEGCDDGDSDSENGCNLNCAISPGWACVNELGKKSVCQKTCGDADMDPGEKCDDGNLAEDDGCSPSCTVEIGYKCDDSKPPAEQCYLACGDGIFDSAEPFVEECDLGDNDPLKGCSTDCKVIEGWVCGGGTMCDPFCGDGKVVGNEPCDDQNSNGGDGCTIGCDVEPGWECANNNCKPICGDGIAIDTNVATEICDDGNQDPGDGCDGACALEADCGNNKVEPGEECDEGAAGNNDCDSNCKIVPTGACSGLLDIDADGMSMVNAGATITTFTGDTTTNPLSSFGDPRGYGLPECTSAISNKIKAHKYTTGPKPSLVTIETENKSVDGKQTFDQTVVWVLRDCLTPTVIDSCKDDGPNAPFSQLVAGYFPARTTLYIAVGDNGDATEAGKYALKITEQPVRLFYQERFNGSLGKFTANDPDGDGAKWKLCNGCNKNNLTISASGGDFAVVDDPPNKNTMNETLRTTLLDVTAPSKLYFQYNYYFKDKGGISDKLESAVSGDGSTWTPLFGATAADFAGRAVSDVTANMSSSQIAVGFLYTDGNGNPDDADYAEVDDIFVFGY
ncbi:MAG: DUF4215 domain-containing protein [Polyangiaceae bacterium]|nr:DUF4215 domain-containing protein [Polyangiaceae bacterium]